MDIKILILSLVLSGFNTQDISKKYYYKESICSVSHSIVNEWELELSEDNHFSLKYTCFDTRLKKPSLNNTIGEWKLLNDTLYLKPEGQKNLYFNKPITYLLKETEIRKLGVNAILPGIMKANQ
jgi:hypothetical protein